MGSRAKKSGRNGQRSGLRIEIDIDRFNPRKIIPAIEALKEGGVIIAPTDSIYSFLCIGDDKNAVDRLRTIKGVTNSHPLSLHCSDISQASRFAVVDQSAHRLLKRYSPGPYTFVLPARRDISKTLRQKREEVGIRISDHLLLEHLLGAIDKPLISTSVTLMGDEEESYDYVDSPVVDLDQVVIRYLNQVDVLIDVGSVPNQLTTVLQLIDGEVTCIRDGIGPYL